MEFLVGPRVYFHGGFKPVRIQGVVFVCTFHIIRGKKLFSGFVFHFILTY